MASARRRSAPQTGPPRATSAPTTATSSPFTAAGAAPSPSPSDRSLVEDLGRTGQVEKPCHGLVPGGEEVEPPAHRLPGRQERAQPGRVDEGDIGEVDDDRADLGLLAIANS